MYNSFGKPGTFLGNGVILGSVVSVRFVSTLPTFGIVNIPLFSVITFTIAYDPRPIASGKNKAVIPQITPGIIGLIKNLILELLANLVVNNNDFINIKAKIAEKKPTKKRLGKAENISKRMNVPFYQDMHEMMRNEDIDVIVILTESGNHAKHVIELANYGKHIIVEKPMALSLEDADRMISACKKNEIKLFVIKQNRFNLPVRKLREAIDQGRFGKIVMGTVRVRWCRKQEYYNDAWHGKWFSDGGVINQQAIHHIDAFNWIVGPVEKVCSLSANQLNKLEAEDTFISILKL